MCAAISLSTRLEGIFTVENLFLRRIHLKLRKTNQIETEVQLRYLNYSAKLAEQEEKENL